MGSRRDSIDTVRDSHGFPFPSADGAHTPKSAFFRQSGIRHSGIETPRTPGSIRASTSAFHLPTAGAQRYFKSRRIRDVSTIQKPWTEKKDPGRKWHTILPLMGVFIGLCLVGLAAYQGFTSVINHTYCPIYDVDFTTGGQLDPKIWTKEVQVGGFG